MDNSDDEFEVEIGSRKSMNSRRILKVVGKLFKI